MVISLCLAYTAGFGVYGLRNKLFATRSGGSREVRIFWEAWNRVERHFFGALPTAEARTYGAIRRSLALLDPYTVIVEPAPRELEQDRLRGAYGGIGVTLWRDAQGRVALAPHPGSPAERAGLVRGDVLVAIDGEPLSRSVTEGDVEALLHGEIGSEVHLTVERSPRTFETTITRQRIEVPSVTWHLEAPDVGYIRLTGFTERTDEELRQALEHVEAAGAVGLVLDLRDNRGGLLAAAVGVAAQFLEEGDVVLHQVGRAEERTFRAQASGDLKTPLSVLVNGGTASAAEIVAGALQDQGRAPLVGEPTFGKGSVQEIYDLPDGSSLHVTTAIWVTPGRHPIDKVGLTPDHPATSSDGPGDEPLIEALRYLESE